MQENAAEAGPRANNAGAYFHGMIQRHENRASTADDGSIGRAKCDDSSGDVGEIFIGLSN